MFEILARVKRFWFSKKNSCPYLDAPVWYGYIAPSEMKLGKNKNECAKIKEVPIWFLKCLIIDGWRWSSWFNIIPNSQKWEKGSNVG